MLSGSYFSGYMDEGGVKLNTENNDDWVGEGTG